MERNQLLKKVQNINNLPTLPSVALKVNKLLKDYESPMGQLVALLEKDQSLVMKILRLVNSSFFGFKSKVKSVSHAVTLLGYNTVQNAVITVSVMDALAIGTRIEGFQIEDFWEHSLKVAVLSRHLSAATKMASAEEAFTAGLLHDIGKVIFINFFPDLFIQILQVVENEHTTFNNAELSLNLPSHGLIGSILAQHWMLPDAMVESTKYHHNGSGKTMFSHLTSVVSISDNIVHMISGDDHYQLGLNSVNEDVGKALSDYFKANPDWYSAIKPEMMKAGEFFGRG